MKKNIAVIFGGKSVEHDISIITGMNVLGNIDKNQYNIIPIYITRTGIPITAKNLDNIEIYKNFEKNAKKCVNLTFLTGKPYIIEKKRHSYKNPVRVDAAILCTHGRGGEDGSLAGVLELSDIPYTSGGVASSAATMDKTMTKDLLLANKIPSVKYVKLARFEVEKNPAKAIEKVEAALSYPVIVKPACLGSSIGISCSHNVEELRTALKIACMYDGKILVEKYLENVTEINCACLGTEFSAIVSRIEVPKKSESILSFSDKYIAERNGKEKPNIDIALEKKVKNLTLKVFKSFSCSGVVRIDFLFDNIAKKLYVNEINSIPGSLAYYLFSSGKFSSFIDELISSALITHKSKLRNKTTYDSAVIDIFSKAKGLRKYTK